MSNVLILGGLGAGQDATRHLLPYLLSLPEAERPAFIRIVDRPLIIPAADAYTCYADGVFRKVIEDGVAKGTVEYVQGNLLTEETRRNAFVLPDHHGGPAVCFDHVFDFTGEIDHATPDAVHMERTLRLASALGNAAREHKVGAYIRRLPTCYRAGKEQKGRVGASGVVAEPWGKLAAWHHEAARALASIEGLKLVLVRPGLLYGPFVVSGVTPRLAVGEVYRHEGEKLDLLWSEDLAQNTVHAADFASALVKTAQWACSQPSREAILETHSEPLAPAAELSKTIVDSVTTSESFKPPGGDIRATVFCAVDDGETTQLDIARVTEEVMGVKIGFQGKIISSFAKLNLDDVTSDVNDKHLESWNNMLHASSPPISSSVPVSPAIPADLLGPEAISFDNSALKRLTGWAPKHSLTAKVTRETVEGFKAEGHWPVLPKGRK
ncbi:hypothetical protein JCM10908_005549 [Rhodotorula pacifica]|uniref:uncharacterized protein n=1 Tax=Rhodotorula pacifica TaxID=1495444 RepID=UPI00317AA3AA